MRYVARFLLCLDSLWSSLIVAKYDSQIITNIRSSRSNSFIQRQICTRAMEVMTLIRQVVGDRRTINFLHDSWLSNLSLSRQPIFINMEIEEPTRNSNLLHIERSVRHPDHVAQLFGPKGAFYYDPYSWCLGCESIEIILQAKDGDKRPLCNILYDTGPNIWSSLDLEARDPLEGQSIYLESSLGSSSYQVNLEGQGSAPSDHLSML